MPQQAAAAKLFVITASDATEAVVLRRGPTNWFHVIRWNMRDDSFEPGAWLRGRIYPEKCDLSPNGRLLLYAALQMRKWRTAPAYSSYTAISRSPWLQALVLWPECGTWGGGGRFASGSHVILASSGLTKHPRHADPAITCSYSQTAWRGSPETVIDGADWAGRDHRGRIILSRNGMLFRRSRSEVMLADFRDMKPTPRPAPSEAGAPLTRGGKASDI